MKFDTEYQENLLINCPKAYIINVQNNSKRDPERNI